MIHTKTVRQVADALHERFPEKVAVNLVARIMLKAVYANRPSEVMFWALVHAHYHGGDLCDEVEQELAMFSHFIEYDASDCN